MQIDMQVACMEMSINSRKSINALISFPIYMPSKMELMRHQRKSKTTLELRGMQIGSSSHKPINASQFMWLSKRN
jgi:hypothetical protein